MRNVAAIIVIASLLVHIALAFTYGDDRKWDVARSPITGVCYETRVSVGMPGWSKTMAPIDDSFCEEE